jgi:DNA polymerase V
VLGNQGACVIAKSYEMKRAGVKTGAPIWEAKAKCPDGVYVKRDFRWYETLSRAMLAAVGTFSPRVEYYSIDEFFWQGLPRPGQSYRQSAVAVRDHVKRSVGVPMTVAFARTRTLAKLFADSAKPFGALAVTDRAEERERLAALPVTEIAGIAKRRAARLAPYGIKTCLDLANASGMWVRKVLTVVGFGLWLELNGEPATPIRTSRTPHQMIARGGSLAGRVSDPHTLYGWLVRNVERLIEELHFHAARPDVLTLYVSYHDGHAGQGVVRLETPTDRFDLLLDAAKLGLRRAWRPGRTATHMHLIASDLKRPGGWQSSLFDPPDPRREALAKVKRAVNDRLGRFTLRSGATLYANRFYADPANDYDVCDIRVRWDSHRRNPSPGRRSLGHRDLGHPAHPRLKGTGDQSMPEKRVPARSALPGSRKTRVARPRLNCLKSNPDRDNRSPVMKLTRSDVAACRRPRVWRTPL